ncbi:MAG: sigma-54-dependent Fis family transcriptional regulator [Gammaproteobacteria bacterium]|nr:sigma-54-dependent Fis family transcriptional regulator [Gammaproteobacteria bacterium]
MQRTVLIVDDERNMLTVMKMTLEEVGYRVLAAASGEDAFALLRDPDLDVVLSDLRMPGMRGEQFVARCHQERPDLPVIVVTAYGSIRSAIECLQAGASDYLCKPFEPEELQFAVRNALRLRDLLQENLQLHAVVSSAHAGQRLIGASAAMQHLRAEIERVAPYKTNVLITGESGTGKEAVARTIHEQGPRADRPWVAINCSAIPRDLIESELFGYVKGAFTGAAQNRMGRLEQANGGTLFLDEIGDLSPDLQAKLLRVLQEREFSPLGSDVIRRVDLRVIAATNRDLHKLVDEGRFREDLLYRLDVYNIRIPPLRERASDIPLLAQAFLDDLRAEMDKSVAQFSADAHAVLAAYDWPGNVRELRNAVERSLLSCRGDVIGVDDLPDKVVSGGGRAERAENVAIAALGNQDLDTWLEDAERRLITDALVECAGVQAQAARRLGISERSLWHRLKKLGIQVERIVQR